MKTDFSRLLYEKYFSLTNRNIEVKLRNGKVVRGVIIGFYKSDEYSNKAYIVKWHMADERNKMSLGIDAFGFMIGEIINTKDIVQVKFFEDNTVINFNIK